MHTDEYEISIGREISLCRRVVKQLTKALDDREKKHGMTTEAFLLTPEQDGLAKQKRDFRKWRDDHEELQKWQKMLSEYERAFQMLKGI
ncbi:MAG: hypothetical protein HQK58_14520 [Deltaproteobacteria bacterium]|nr:hypothetical protein [Deltaproteobacteria bacterium]MBF0525053.1 hypothetical protein [Deltaproteobacteria bacterium]